MHISDAVIVHWLLISFCSMYNAHFIIFRWIVLVFLLKLMLCCSGQQQQKIFQKITCSHSYASFFFSWFVLDVEFYEFVVLESRL